LGRECDRFVFEEDEGERATPATDEIPPPATTMDEPTSPSTLGDGPEQLAGQKRTATDEPSVPRSLKRHKTRTVVTSRYCVSPFIFRER
jgi:hypothetical protein